VKPLRDQPDPKDPALVRLAELVRASRPLAPSEVRKERVRAALSGVEGTGARIAAQAQRPRGPRAWVVRPAVAALAILGSMAIASAMIGRAWIEHRRASTPTTHLRPVSRHAAPSILSGAPEPAPEPASPPRSTPARRAVHAPHVRPSSPLASTASSKETAPSVALTPEEPPATTGVPAPIAPAALSPTVAPIATPAHREAELAAAAVKKLRVDHDPKGSLVLFQGYLRRYPHGALTEEVWGLAIEAAAAYDDRAAVRLAREYLERSPAGRFALLARQAIDRAGR
jgi:hypothetical protein